MAHGVCLLLWSLVITTLAAPASGEETNWPRWRGPAGTGHSTETSLPVAWQAGDIAWKLPLKGRGQSSPVIWGDRIFLTTALDDSGQRMVLCADRRDGKLLWEQAAPWTGQPEKLHKMNSLASATCATDGQYVAAFFGRGGLHCYTVEGKHVWSKDLGPFDVNPWGTAACPIILGDLIIQNCDNDVDACLIAVRKQTGEIAWRTPRPNFRGWSTPILLEVEGRPQLLLNGDTGVMAYDPQTGRELWFCKGFNGRGEPTVTPGEELVYLVNGKAGDVYAVRPGGEGDVTKSRMAWHTPRRSGRDLPSPILIGNYLIVVSMSGVGTCYDAATGKVLWNERLGGNYSASPFAANGLAYFLNEDGETVVVEPGPELKIVARNPLNPSGDEIFRASLTPCRGQIFARSDRVLYCIGRATAE
jgi:outer membrane protein assembly factor BamB